MRKSSFITTVGDDLTKLATTVRKAIADYNSTFGPHAEVFSPCSRASLIHDLMVRNARIELPPLKFRHVTAGQRELFNVEDKFLIQFKKLDRGFRSSNYPTYQAELFEEAGEIEGLPGIASTLQLITVGYVPTDYFSAIEGIFATQTIDHRPAWVERLTEEGDGQITITSILTPPPHDTTHKKQSRIKRPDASEQASTGNS